MIHSLFSVPAIPIHCRRKVDILLLPVDHTENIVAVGLLVTTAINPTVTMFTTNILYINM